MQIKYFAWKDGKKSEAKQEWVELTPKEFIEICNNNRNLKPKERRFFYQLPGLEKGDCYMYLECTFEQYIVSRSERNNRIQKRKEMAEFEKKGEFNSMVSLDLEIVDACGEISTLHDLIPDVSSTFENSSAASVDLHNAINLLSFKERKLIYDLYFGPKGQVSVNKLAKKKKVSQQALNKRKLRIFKKIRKMGL